MHRAPSCVKTALEAFLKVIYTCKNVTRLQLPKHEQISPLQKLAEAECNVLDSCYSSNYEHRWRRSKRLSLIRQCKGPCRKASCLHANCSVNRWARSMLWIATITRYDLVVQPTRDISLKRLRSQGSIISQIRDGVLHIALRSRNTGFQMYKLGLKLVDQLIIHLAIDGWLAGATWQWVIFALNWRYSVTSDM